MKTSNIFLLFLVTFFVIAGHEVAIAARIDQLKCKLESHKGTGPCVPDECMDLCVKSFNPWLSPSEGYCAGGSICQCYSVFC
ncbi:hypothetical protein LINGRAHAP2_LOCUS36341 [Linum grandiflorum]